VIITESIEMLFYKALDITILFPTEYCYTGCVHDTCIYSRRSWYVMREIFIWRQSRISDFVVHKS